MYGKHFASMYEGSMYGMGAVPFAVWGYIISHVDEKGYLEINPVMLADVIGEPEDKIKAALKELMQPDPRSRCKEDGGRRLVKEGQFLCRVPSYPTYRAIYNKESRRESLRLASKKYREKQKEEVAE